MAGLTKTAIRDFKNAKGEPFGKQAAGITGFYLLHGKNGSKLWRLKFFHEGKECVLALGVYPDVSVDAAERRAQEARRLIVEGKHPLHEERAQEAAQKATQARTFSAVAAEFLKHTVQSKLADKTLAGYRGALKNHVRDVLGSMPVADIKLSDVNRVLKQSGITPVMAKYALGMIKRVLDYAELHDYVERNVAAGRRGLLPKHKTVNRVAITDEVELGRFLARLDEYAKRGGTVVAALQLLVLLPVRPMELCQMAWKDVDLDRGQWSFVVPKTDREHIVMLCPQAVTILRSLRAQHTVGKWVFPSPLHPPRHISRDSLLAALVNGVGYERGTISLHGFRSTFQTIAHERLRCDPVVLEIMLGHAMPGPLKDVYDKAQLLEQRREVADAYGAHLDRLRSATLLDES